MGSLTAREPGWAEMFLPLQALEVGNIRIQEPKKSSGPGVPLYAIDRPIAALSQVTDHTNLPTLAVLTPFLKVSSWDSSTGRLDLEVEPESITATKCAALQEMILELLTQKPQWFISGHKVHKDEVRANFQPMYHGNTLTIYLHGVNPEKKTMGRVWIWRNSGWQKGANPNSFQKGQQLRVALRFQGVCFLPATTGRYRYRLQHQTIAIFQRLN